MTILYGARTPGLLCFRDNLTAWAAQKNSIVLVTVDAPDEGWQGNVGVVTSLLSKVEIETDRTTAFVCGPPIMIHFVIEDLIKMGLPRMPSSPPWNEGWNAGWESADIAVLARLRCAPMVRFLATVN